MDGVDEGDSAFVAVGHQVVPLRQPGRTARGKKNKTSVSILVVVGGFLKSAFLACRPVAAEPGVPAGAALQRRCQATESGRHGIPLVEADAAAEGVAPRRALGALLRRHLQELPGLAGERWSKTETRTPGDLRSLKVIRGIWTQWRLRNLIFTSC